METKKYGLRLKHNKKILSFRQTSNDGSEFCHSTTTQLSEFGDTWWLVDEPYKAEYVRNCSTEWYNATYETPKHGFKKDELEIVEIITQIEPVEIKIPTIEEYIDLAYKEKEPEHHQYLLGELKKSYTKFFYTLYDLNDLIRNGKWKPNK